MLRTRRIRVRPLLAIQVALVALGLAGGAWATSVLATHEVQLPAGANTSRLMIVAAPDPEPQPLPEALAKAWSDARWLADSASADFGAPWADRVTGHLVVAPTGERGRALVRAWTTEGVDVQLRKPMFLSPPSVPVTERVPSRSWADLQLIADDATRLVAAGVTDADLMRTTTVDVAHDRVVLTVARFSEPLFASLAARYGTEAIAVRIDPNAGAVPTVSVLPTPPLFIAPLLGALLAAVLVLVNWRSRPIRDVFHIQSRRHR